MITVFGSFILNGDPIVKQFGVGLSVSVLLAAGMTLLLAPAILVLFRGALWWLPRAVGRLLPDLGVEEDDGALPRPVAEPVPAFAEATPVLAGATLGTGPQEPGGDAARRPERGPRRR